MYQTQNKISAHIPDNATTGGNARGNNSVDLQVSRSAASQIASGAGSYLCGSSNTASGANSSVLGGTVCSATNDNAVSVGYSNTASGKYSTALGRYTTSSLYGQFSFSCAEGANQQYSFLFFERYSNNATPVELFLDGYNATTRAVLNNRTAWFFEADILAHDATTIGQTAAFKRYGIIKRTTSAATTALEGVVQTIGTDIINSNLNGISVEFTADTVNGSLKVMVTGLASSSISWKIVLKIIILTI